MAELKIISLGIDGASWGIIKRGIDAGLLKSFEGLCKESILGTLTSIPPITYPQWYVLLSGLNPGNIGVYDFVTYDRVNNVLRVTTPWDFKGKNICDHLSENRIRFAIINTPGIIPTKSNYYGYIVGDPIYPKLTCHPTRLKIYLKKSNYKHFDIRLTKLLISKQKVKQIKYLYSEILSSRIRLLKYLLSRDYKIRFAHCTLFAIDNIQHYFWDDEIMWDIWKMIDLYLYDLILFLEKHFQKNYVLFIVSDHGFTGIKWLINIYPLINIGIMKRKNSSKLLKHLIKMLSGNTLGKLFYLTLNYLPNDSVKNSIEWLSKKISESDQYSLSDSFKIMVDGNSLYLKANEISKTNRNQLLDEIYLSLYNLRDSNGRQLIYPLKVKSIFRGKYLNNAPDIMFFPNIGYHITKKSSTNTLLKKPIKGVDWIGTHTFQSIFIMYSPLISKRIKVHGSTVDYLPTIYQLLQKKEIETDGKKLFDMSSVISI